MQLCWLYFFLSSTYLVFLLNKGVLIAYSRVYNNIPFLALKIYKNILLPIISFTLIILFIFLFFNKVNVNLQYQSYYLLFIIPSFLYSVTTLKKKDYYAELLVLINIILFLTITGMNEFFYKLYPVPIINQININQITIIILSGIIIFFALFKERINNIKEQYLTGTDLILAVLITFIYLAVQFIDLPYSYLISDTLLRSFLVYLFYKIIIAVKPGLHFSLYYTSFLIAALAVIKSIF